MIDERHEELASLYALDLLQGDERAQFEAVLARDTVLQRYVRGLRDASSQLAYSATAKPPSVLKARVLATIAEKVAAEEKASRKIVRPAHFSLRTFIPWAIAASFAVASAFVGLRYFSTQTELAQLRQQHAIVDVERQSLRQQIEAGRIVTQRQFQNIDQQLNAAQTELVQTRKQLETETARLAALTNESTSRSRQLTDIEVKLSTTEQQLATARRQVVDRERHIAALTQQVNTLTAARTELSSQLDETRLQVAKLADEMKYQADLADLKITLLASLAKNRPQAHAVAVWDPKKKEGVLKVRALPALAANQDYQLWIVDPAYKDPVDGGVFTVDPQTGEATLTIKTKQPISVIDGYAITRERKGGVPKAENNPLLYGKQP